MTGVEAIILGVVQGFTEFLPISSSGHLILAREFFNWEGGQELAFDAILHLATAFAVIVYFWKDVWQLKKSFFKWVLRQEAPREDLVLIAGLVIATIPAVIAGLLLEDLMETTFRSAALVAVTLIIGSVVMIAAEKWGRRQTDVLGWKKALTVGLFQSLALIPGMSRSGMAISGGMLMGLSREAAGRFAFLLLIPLMLGAGGKKLLDLSSSGELVTLGSTLVLGGITAFLVGLGVIHFLLKYLRTRTLWVFIGYRLILAGILIVGIFVV